MKQIARTDHDKHFTMNKVNVTDDIFQSPIGFSVGSMALPDFQVQIEIEDDIEEEEQEQEIANFPENVDIQFIKHYLQVIKLEHPLEVRITKCFYVRKSLYGPQTKTLLFPSSVDAGMQSILKG